MADENYRLLVARLQDAIRLCECRNKPKFIGFLDEASAAVALEVARKSRVSFLFYGGHPEAERRFIGFFPDCIEPAEETIPLQGIRFTYRAADKPTHRDILGALMHCGIERETVGDILIDSTYAVAFVAESVTRHILGQIETVGRAGVTVSLFDGENLPSLGTLTECSDTISSERLDCVVSALANCSRSEACLWIEQGKVAINGLPQEKITKQVCEGDKITLRGKGKFIIQSLAQRTKKGRIILNYKKYI